MSSSCKVILDSVSNKGKRLVTFEGKMHRFVLAEFNTHRMFSRNSASSRAIPIKKQIERVLNDPAIPVEWGANRPGMQATDVISHTDMVRAKRAWLRARDMAVTEAELLDKLGVHKQIANRLLEPFMWHTVVFTTTEDGLENFFDQRCTSRSPLAQPEMRAFADEVLDAYKNSTPNITVWDNARWHTPYIFPEDGDLPLEKRIRVSTARCARVSYLTQDGRRDTDIDEKLYYRLISAKPMHASPLEHVALPVSKLNVPGNLSGWAQWRHMVNVESELDALLEKYGPVEDL